MSHALRGLFLRQSTQAVDATLSAIVADIEMAVLSAGQLERPGYVGSSGGKKTSGGAYSAIASTTSVAVHGRSSVSRKSLVDRS